MTSPSYSAFPLWRGAFSNVCNFVHFDVYFINKKHIFSVACCMLNTEEHTIAIYNMF